MDFEQLAVFTRNHSKYLMEAARRASGRKTTFRSRARWASASYALQRYGPRPIYFAEVDGGGVVTYEANLVEVFLDPDAKHPGARSLLEHELKATSREGLWNDSVKTLYAITDCRPVKKPFPQSRLILLKHNARIDKNYIRSYALVRALS
jgi:hypothetical protein